MRTDLTYTPDPEAEAAILPCLPDHLRAQALRLLAELSEHARSIEKPAQGSRVSLNRSRKHIRVPKSKERVELAARCV
jgi:hypothetical protein